MRFIYYLFFLFLTLNFDASAKSGNVAVPAIKIASFAVHTHPFSKKFIKDDQQHGQFFIIDNNLHYTAVHLPLQHSYFNGFTHFNLQQDPSFAAKTGRILALKHPEITTFLYTKHFFK